MRKLYGSLHNRLAENNDYCEEIKVGTGMTEYFCSDRHAYEVVKVIDQRHVVVREYDHELDGECYTNKWKLISNPNNPKMLMVKRGNKWYQAVTIEKEDVERLLQSEDTEDKLKLCHIMMAGFDTERIQAKGQQTKYFKKNVSFGVADYYYDYSF